MCYYILCKYSCSPLLLQLLKAIVTEATNLTELVKRNSKFLASFLGLAVQIREKLVTAEAFADAVTGLPILLQRNSSGCTTARMMNSAWRS